MTCERIHALALTAALTVDGLSGPTYRQALAFDNPEKQEWQAAIDKELNTLQSRGTWIMVPKADMRNSGKKPVRHKFVLKKKLIKDGSVQYKARLVACGYTQVAGQDFSKPNCMQAYARILQ